jgi:hypothetical protein
MVNRRVPFFSGHVKGIFHKKIQAKISGAAGFVGTRMRPKTTINLIP